MATRKGMVRKTRPAGRLAYFPKRKSRFRSSPKLKKSEASLARVRAQLRKARAAGKSSQGPLMEAAAVTAGGALSGVASGFMPDGIMGVDTSLIGGAALVAAGVYFHGAGNKQIGQPVTCLGSGMLAAWAAGVTSSMLEE